MLRNKNAAQSNLCRTKQFLTTFFASQITPTVQAGKVKAKVICDAAEVLHILCRPQKLLAAGESIFTAHNIFTVRLYQAKVRKSTPTQPIFLVKYNYF